MTDHSDCTLALIWCSGLMSGEFPCAHCAYIPTVLKFLLCARFCDNYIFLSASCPVLGTHVLSLCPANPYSAFKTLPSIPSSRRPTLIPLGIIICFFFRDAFSSFMPSLHQSLTLCCNHLSVSAFCYREGGPGVLHCGAQGD